MNSCASWLGRDLFVDLAMSCPLSNGGSYFDESSVNFCKFSIVYIAVSKTKYEIFYVEFAEVDGTNTFLLVRELYLAVRHSSADALLKIALNHTKLYMFLYWLKVLFLKKISPE